MHKTCCVPDARMIIRGQMREAMHNCTAQSSRLATHLRGLARACFTNDDDDLVLANDLQQVVPDIVHGQQLALLSDGVALRKLADLHVRPKETSAWVQQQYS